MAGKTRFQSLSAAAFLAQSVSLAACSGAVSSNKDASVGDAAAGGDAPPVADSDATSGPPTGVVDAAAEAAPPPVLVTATQLIDDMRSPLPDGPGLQNSAWYVYSGRDLPWSVPPIQISDAGGLSPAEDVAFDPTDDDGGPTSDAGSLPYRRVAGGGALGWGMGFGLDFVDGYPDGGDIPVNDCEAGAFFSTDSGIAAIPSAFDASAWTGVEFWVRSFRSSPQVVSVKVDDQRTTPFGLPADAGGCDYCGNTCANAPGVSITFRPEWTQVQVPFASMHPTFDGETLSSTPQSAALYDLHFEITGGSVPPFDVGVAYVEFYR